MGCFAFTGADDLCIVCAAFTFNAYNLNLAVSQNTNPMVCAACCRFDRSIRADLS
jgi:hypothetical protein